MLEADAGFHAPQMWSGSIADYWAGVLRNGVKKNDGVTAVVKRYLISQKEAFGLGAERRDGGCAEMPFGNFVARSSQRHRERLGLSRRAADFSLYPARCLYRNSPQIETESIIS